MSAASSSWTGLIRCEENSPVDMSRRRIDSAWQLPTTVSVGIAGIVDIEPPGERIDAKKIILMG